MQAIIFINSSTKPYNNNDFNNAFTIGETFGIEISGKKNCMNDIGSTAINPIKHAKSWCENFTLYPSVKIKIAAINGKKHKIIPNIICVSCKC